MRKKLLPQYDHTSHLLSGDFSQAIVVFRAILALMVINIHSINTEVHFTDEIISYDASWLVNIEYFCSQVISRMAVPAFFLLSGFLLYRKSFSWFSNLKKKAISLLVPYFLINTIWILLFAIGQSLPFLSAFFTMESNHILSWKVCDWLKAYGFNSAPLVANLWFLRDLFVLNVLSILFIIPLKKCPIICVLIAFVFWISPHETHLFFLDKQAFCFWVFGGALAANCVNVNKLCSRIRLDYVFPVYFLFLILDFGTRNTLINSVFHGVQIIIGIVFWFVLSKALISNYSCKLFKVIGTYSFGLYLFHEYALNILMKIYSRFLPNSPLVSLLGYVFVPTVLTALCVLLCLFLDKKMPKLYCFITGKIKKGGA